MIAPYCEPLWATENRLVDAVTAQQVRPALWRALFDRLVVSLVLQARRKSNWPNVYHHARHVLVSLGLPPKSLTTATCRLRNAQLYSARREFGAAEFELKMLRRQLY